MTTRIVNYSELSELCQNMYELFGAWAVTSFIADRQSVGDLSHITWANCEPCEWLMPYDFGFTGCFCLVCGTCPDISPITGERQ